MTRYSHFYKLLAGLLLALLIACPAPASAAWGVNGEESLEHKCRLFQTELTAVQAPSALLAAYQSAAVNDWEMAYAKADDLLAGAFPALTVSERAELDGNAHLLQAWYYHHSGKTAEEKAAQLYRTAIRELSQAQVNDASQHALRESLEGLAQLYLAAGRCQDAIDLADSYKSRLTTGVTSLQQQEGYTCLGKIYCQSARTINDASSPKLLDLYKQAIDYLSRGVQAKDAERLLYLSRVNSVYAASLFANDYDYANEQAIKSIKMIEAHTDIFNQLSQWPFLDMIMLYSFLSYDNMLQGNMQECLRWYKLADKKYNSSKFLTGRSKDKLDQMLLRGHRKEIDRQLQVYKFLQTKLRELKYI